MQSAVSGLMQAFKAAFSTDGTDWDYVPYDMYLYGGGGIAGWGSLCGIPNGCAAVLNLIGLHGVLSNGLPNAAMDHYASTLFPTSLLPDLYEADSGYGPTDYTYVKVPAPDDEVLAHTVSHSPLCHVSISKWCYAAGIDVGVANAYTYGHKNDRCGKVCADMAAYTAELINAYALGNGCIDPALPYQTAECMTCHKGKGNPPGSPASVGKMDCVECHSPEDQFHGGRRIIVDDVWTSDPDDHSDPGVSEFNPVDTFTSGGKIRYNVRYYMLGAGSSWVTVKMKAKDSAGTKIDAQSSAATVPSGPVNSNWDDTIQGTDALGRAVVKFIIKLFDYQGGNKYVTVYRKHKFTIV